MAKQETPLAPCLWQELLLALLGFPGDVFQASYTDGRPTLRLAEDLHWIEPADRHGPAPQRLQLWTTGA